MKYFRPDQVPLCIGAFTRRVINTFACGRVLNRIIHLIAGLAFVQLCLRPVVAILLSAVVSAVLRCANGRRSHEGCITALQQDPTKTNRLGLQSSTFNHTQCWRIHRCGLAPSAALLWPGKSIPCCCSPATVKRQHLNNGLTGAFLPAVHTGRGVKPLASGWIRGIQPWVNIVSHHCARPGQPELRR